MQPDVQAALEEVVSAIVGETHTYGFLTVGFEKNLPAVHVDVTQKEDVPFATHTASVAVYERDTTTARELMRGILGVLTAGQVPTGAGLLDLVEVDVGAKNVPYADQNVVLFTAVIRIHTRAL